MRSIVCIAIVFAVSLIGVQCDHPAALNNERIAFQAIVAWQSQVSLFVGCSIFPLSMSLNCQIIDPPIRAYMQSDFIAAGYDAQQYDAMMWMSMVSTLGKDMIKPMIEANVSSCTTYSYGVINNITDMLELAQLLTSYSPRMLASSLAAITSRSKMIIVAQSMSSQARVNAIMRLFTRRPMITSPRFAIGMSFDEAARAFRPYQLNCSSMQLVPFTTRPFGRAYQLDGGTNFTGPLSAQFDMRYTDENKANDLVTLMFLLAMHRVHAAYFLAGAQTFTESFYTYSGRIVDVAETLTRMAIYEQTNVDVLITLITQLTGDSHSTDRSCEANFDSAMVAPNAFIAYAYQMMDLSVSVTTTLTTTVIDTELQKLIPAFAINDASVAAYLGLLLTGWRGSGYTTGVFGMGMLAVPMVQTALDPSLWLETMPFSVMCPELATPVRASDEDPDNMPDVAASSSTASSVSSSSSSSTGPVRTGANESPHLSGDVLRVSLLTFVAVVLSVCVCY